MKIGKDKIKMSSGEVRKFKSAGARDRYEGYVRALKHGWRPTGKKGRKRVTRRKKVEY